MLFPILILHSPRIASAVLYSSPLWIAHPYEILLTSQYFKIPLFESALLLILYWSFYLTYFITIYPPLSLAPQFHPILYEPLPLLIHILFVYILTILLLAVMIYTHHRMQFVVDTRRAGVWVVHSSNEPPASNPPPSSNPSTPRSSSSNPSHKVPQWKPTHSYRLNDICTFEQQQYRLISPFSSYSLPPIVTSSLSYKYFIYTIMNKESGPLSQSYVLTCLLQFLSVVGCSIIVVGLLYPRQVLMTSVLFIALISSFHSNKLVSFSMDLHSPYSSIITRNPSSHHVSSTLKGSHSNLLMMGTMSTIPTSQANPHTTQLFLLLFRKGRVGIVVEVGVQVVAMNCMENHRNTSTPPPRACNNKSSVHFLAIK